MTTDPMPPEKKLPQTRPPLARMLRIHALLQQDKYPNCATLAKQLEISTKTAQRDLEFMRDRLDLPLDYDRVRHGYHYTEEVVNFPTVQVTEGEVVALLVAQKAMEQYRGTPFEQPLRRAVEKLAAGLEDEVSFDLGDTLDTFSFHAFGVAPVEPAVFERLAQAVRARREVTFDYTKPKTGRTEPRHVQPYHLANLQQCWYLIARDVTKDAFRLFALPRIKAVKLTREAFRRPADFSVRDFLANAFGPYAGGSTQTVKIEFDAQAAPYIRERIWHKSQTLEPLPDGRLILTMQVPRLEPVNYWVESWGDHASILAPIDLNKKPAGKFT